MAISSPAHKPAENPAEPTMRDRILKMLGIEITVVDYMSERLQPLFRELDSKREGHLPRIKEAIVNEPGASRILSRFLEPELEFEDAFELLQELNENFGPIGKRHGRSYSAILHMPNGRSLTIHYFSDMNALSADLDWKA